MSSQERREQVPKEILDLAEKDIDVKATIDIHIHHRIRWDLSECLTEIIMVLSRKVIRLQSTIEHWEEGH